MSFTKISVQIKVEVRKEAVHVSICSWIGQTRFQLLQNEIGGLEWLRVRTLTGSNVTERGERTKKGRWVDNCLHSISYFHKSGHCG